MRAKPESVQRDGDRQPRDARAGARRTALLFGGIAIAIYALFILSGVIGR